MNNEFKKKRTANTIRKGRNFFTKSKRTYTRAYSK